ncbi:Hypothetical_protein [Hexamita inflata]|uniref:Hypothetical_protein n=1 Tax=Hexamita inflata TaxID=28002 RepID=A0ABP1JEZ2_9EUKA
MLKPLTRCLMRIVTANMSPTSFLQFVQPLLLLLQLLLIDRLWLGLGVFGWIARWTSRHMLSGKRWIRSEITSWIHGNRRQLFKYTEIMQQMQKRGETGAAWRHSLDPLFISPVSAFQKLEKHEILKWTLASREAAEDEVGYKFVDP